MKTPYLITIAATLMLAGCGDSSEPGGSPRGPANDPDGNPGGLPNGEAPWSVGLALSAPVPAEPGGGNQGGAVVFVSITPGTIAGAASVQIKSGGVLSRALAATDGGFDPVAVAAEEGDAIEVDVTDSTGGETTVSATARQGVRPRVVRTSPAARKTDVPLNVRLSVVFTTPMDAASLIGGLSVLVGGVAVPGHVELTSDGLAMEFTPTSPLAANSDYDLRVDGSVRDVLGTTLGVGVVVSFRTVANDPLPLPPRVYHLTVTTLTSGTDPDPDGYLIKLQGNLIATTSLASPNGSVTFIVTEVNQFHPHDYYLSIEGLAPNCVADQPFRERMVESSDITETFAVTCAPVRQLVAVIGQGPGAEIYLINSNGTGAIALTSNTVLDDDPVWSPDGSHILFSSERDGDREIYAMDANGSSPVRITNTAGTDERPAWAPDGNRIAFVSNRDGNAEIYVMNADGTGQTRLTDSPWEDTDPAWSPDGGKIAFASSRSGVPNIHVMNADGTATAQLSFDIAGASSSQPAWSPDGLSIAYVQTVSLYGGYSSVVVMTSNGYPADAIGVVYGRNDRVADPAWSPDGGQIAVTQLTCLPGPGCQYDVVVFPNVSNSTFGFGLSRMLRTNTRNPAWRP